VSLHNRKLYTLRLGKVESPIGYLGKMPTWKDTFTGEFPYATFILPESIGKYVRIDWKTKKVYDALNGKLLGKLPHKLRWEDYKASGKRDKTTLKRAAAKIRRRNIAVSTMRKAGIEILPHHTLAEELNPAFQIERLKREIP
jgi:hypothetical protein